MLDAGTPVRSQQGRLELYPSTFTERLERLLLEARGELRRRSRVADPGSFSSTSARGGGPVEGDFLIIRVIDPDRGGRPLDATKLSGRFGLTVRQAEAVAALVKGGSEESASAALNAPRRPCTPI